MINCQKHLFSLRPDIHYLNNSYKAPLLRSSEQAAMEALRWLRNPSEMRSDDFFRVQKDVRVAFGKLIGATSERVAILPSVSYGMANVFANIDASPGDNVVTVFDEFPSGYFAAKKWADQHEAEMIIVKPEGSLQQRGPSWNSRVIAAITPKAKAVVLSSVHWMSGVKFDLKAIGDKCRSVGAKFIVDGSQSVGALPIDVEEFGIDALINAGYKWLFGPYSMALGFFGSAFDNGRPIEESWMNRDNAEDFSSLSNYSMSYSEMAGRYNVGESSFFITMPMMRTALNQVNEWTPEGIQEYCEILTQPVLNFFHEHELPVEEGKYFSPHLFDLRLPESIDVDQLKRTLRDHQVIVSSRGKSIRLAFNVFNEEEDVTALLTALKTHF